MTNEEIKEIIEKHQHWLKKDCEGWEECAPGIHCFITRNEAVNY
jgi:hypothetical protein